MYRVIVDLPECRDFLLAPAARPFMWATVGWFSTKEAAWAYAERLYATGRYRNASIVSPV